MTEEWRDTAEQLPLFDPIKIPLTRGYVALVDPIDADLLRYKWCISTQRHKVYACRGVSAHGKWTTEQLHRVILSRMTQRRLLRSEYSDHINGNGLDNRRANLRLSTGSENGWNRGKQVNNTSGYKGVFQIGNRMKWRAQIRHLGKSIHLGTFDNREEAHAAYCEAVQCIAGEFARLE